MWKSYRSFLSGSQGGKAAVLWDRRRLRKMNSCDERSAVTAGEMFAQLTQVLGARVCLCIFTDGWTANLNCHIMFPAKHMAAAQNNGLASAEVIMVSINSSKQGLTPKALHSALVYFHSKSPCGISLTTANTNVMYFQSGREHALICLLKTTIPCWNSNLSCKVSFRGPCYLTGFHL